MNIHPIIVAALIMGTVILSGQGKMNLIHHEVLPQVLAEQQIVTITTGIIRNQIDIRLPSELKEEDTVRGVIKALQEAGPLDKVIFHMAGQGGEVETVELLINNIKACKAHVVMIVEAPVYSGHAYISLSGDELIMWPYSYLMLHTSSIYGHDCSLETGEDRTVSNTEHCQAFMDAHMALINKLLLNFKILTTQEVTSIMSGHDFYLSADQYNLRK